MQDWPIIAPVATLVIGIIMLLLNRIVGQDQLFHTRWKIVLFVISAGIFQVCILGRDYWGVSATGLFRLDGLNTHLVFAFLAFSFFSHIGLRFDSVEFESEISVLQLSYVLCGVVAILANNLILYIIAMPLLFMIMVTAPMLNAARNKRRGFRTAVTGGFVLIGLTALSAGFFAHSADSVLLNEIVKFIGTTKTMPQFYMGWILHVCMLLSFLLLPPFAFALEAYQECQSWSLVGFFRMSLPLLAILLLTKWIILTGVVWQEPTGFVVSIPLPLSEVSGILLCLIYLAALFLLFFSQRIIVLISAVSMMALVLALMIALLQRVEGYSIAQTGIYLYMLVVSVFCFSLSEMRLPTTATLENFRQALQQSPISLQLSMFVSLVIATPALNYVGFDFVKTVLTEMKTADELMFVIFVLALVFFFLASSVICYRLIELFTVNAKRNLEWDPRHFTAKLWSYILLLTLIILGIYPTPLYKYLSHSINLFVKNV